MTIPDVSAPPTQARPARRVLRTVPAGPGTDLRAPGARPMRVGLDIGGTKTDAVAVDPAGTIVSRLRLETEWGSEGVVRTVLAAVHAVAAEAPDSTPIVSVGIGIPGQIEPGTGRVRLAASESTRRQDSESGGGHLGDTWSEPDRSGG